MWSEVIHLRFIEKLDWYSNGTCHGCGIVVLAAKSEGWRLGCGHFMGLFVCR